MNLRKNISVKVKRQLMLIKQCANNPLNFAPGCKNYICPLWKNGGNGCFDESGFQIDHIIEVTHGGTNDVENLQLLCPCCHSVKTKRCSKQNWNYTSAELDTGLSKMDWDFTLKRKRIVIEID